MNFFSVKQGTVKKTREDVSKKIMPNKCDLCGIGIGKSMLFYDGTWRMHKHIEKKPYYYDWEGGRIKICSECRYDLKKNKNAKVYLKRLFSNPKRSGEHFLEV